MLIALRVKNCKSRKCTKKEFYAHGFLQGSTQKCEKWKWDEKRIQNNSVALILRLFNVGKIKANPNST